jgi:integron integrase
MAKSTESAYCGHVADFFSWSDCGDLECLDGKLVEDYLTHLAVDRKVSASTQNQAFNALLFLFRRVIGKGFGEVRAQRAKVSQHIPEWLNRDELQALFKELSGDWLLLTQLAYGTGLRLMELLRLRVKDLDFGNGLVHVHDGKGGKNRVVPMPKSIVRDLMDRVANTERLHITDLANGYGEVWLPNALAKKYPKAAKDLKWQWLFPSRTLCNGDGKLRRHHLFPNGFQTELRKAGERAGIKKRVHPHALRHSYSTSYLENSGSLLLLQELLGHKHLETTKIYLHCIDARRAVSPLDVL